MSKLSKLRQILNQLKGDFMKSPRSMQVGVSLGMVAIVVVILGIVSGCSYGPSKAFVLKMNERAGQHFPRYIYLLENADQSDLENILDKPVGAFDGVSESDLDMLRNSQKNAVNAWWFEIKQNRILLDEDKGENNDG